MTFIDVVMDNNWYKALKIHRKYHLPFEHITLYKHDFPFNMSLLFSAIHLIKCVYHLVIRILTRYR